MGNGQNLYFEWNYDEGVVIAYERLGECNGCGDCCKAAIQYTVAGQFHQEGNPGEKHGNGGSETSGQGIWSEVNVGDDRRFFCVLEVKPNTGHCSHLTGDSRCDIQLTKPPFDKAWPMSPRQTAPFARCSYTFHEVAHWSLEALQATAASPGK